MSDVEKFTALTKSVSMLAGRHQRMVNDYALEYRETFKTFDTNSVQAYLLAWTDAMKLLWSDAEEFFGQDPNATEYICRLKAIEMVMWDKLTW